MNTDKLVEQLQSALTPEQVRVLASALAQHARVLCIDGTPYAAVPDGAGDHWVYQLAVSAPEYHASAATGHCTCPSQERPCKHVRALRGASVDTSRVPWAPPPRKKGRRKRSRNDARPGR